MNEIMKILEELKSKIANQFREEMEGSVNDGYEIACSDAASKIEKKIEEIRCQQSEVKNDKKDVS